MKKKGIIACQIVDVWLCQLKKAKGLIVQKTLGLESYQQRTLHVFRWKDGRGGDGKEEEEKKPLVFLSAGSG